MKRNSAAMVAIRAADTGRFLVPALLLGFSALTRVDGFLQVVLVVAMVLYCMWRAHFIVADWYATRYEISDDGLRWVRDLMTREEIEVAWGDVVSVQSSSPTLHRLFHRAKVQVGAGGRRAPVVLEALSLADADRLVAAHEQSRRLVAAGTMQQDQEAAAEVDGERADLAPPRDPQPGNALPTVVHEMSRLEYFMLSISYGKFFFFLPFAIGAYSEAADWLDLPAPDISSGLAGLGARSWFLLVAGGVAAALAYGWAVSWLRYRSYRVVASGGALTISSGLVAVETVVVDLSSIRGLKVEQNPLMKIFRYGRLSYLGRETGGALSRNAVFPAVRYDRLVSGVRRFFPDHHEMLLARPRRGGSLRAAAVGTALTWLCCSLALALPGVEVSPGAAVGAAMATTVALSAVLELLTFSVVVDSSTSLVRVDQGLLWTRSYQFPVGSVHLLTSTVDPIARVVGRSWTSLLIWDGRCRRLSGLAVPRTDVMALRESLIGEVGGRAPRTPVLVRDR